MESKNLGINWVSVYSLNTVEKNESGPKYEHISKWTQVFALKHLTIR